MLRDQTTTSTTTERLATVRRWAGAGGAIWGAAFGLLSLYWALGGRVGLHQLGTGIQEQVAHPTTGFTISLWASVVAKAIACLLGIALMVPLDRIVPRWLLLIAGWAGGIGLTLYGLAGITQAALIVIGVIDAPSSMGADAAPWYLGVWEPTWLTGGLLFLAAVVAYQRTSRGRGTRR